MDLGNYEAKSIPIKGCLVGVRLAATELEENGKLLDFNAEFKLLACLHFPNLSETKAIQSLASLIFKSEEKSMLISDKLYFLSGSHNTFGDDISQVFILYPDHSSDQVSLLYQKRIQEQLGQKEGILSSIPDLIYIISKEGIYLDCRASNQKDLPIPMDQVVGSSFWDMPESIELKQAVWQRIEIAIQSGETQTIEYERKNRFGIQQYYESRISRSDENTAVYFVRNITESVEAKNQLASSELKWKSIVENGYDCILLVNRDGRIVYISSNSKAFLGKSPDELLGTQAVKILPQYTLKLIRVFYALLKEEISKTNISFENKDQHGTLQYLESSWVSCLNDSSINAIIVNIRDVTRQIEYEADLRSNQETIETIIRTTTAGIVILDGTKIIYLNDQFADLLGFEKEELLNQNISHFTHLDDLSKALKRARRRTKENTSQTHYKIRALTRDKTQKWLDVHSGDIMYLGISATIVTVYDITEQHDYEAKLIEAKEGAEELAQLKSSFLANMSHEIRTPLNGVLGLAELISLSQDLNEVKEFVSLQKISGMRLLNTLTSILDLSRLESENTALQLVPVNLNKLITETEELFRIPFQQKGIELHIKLPETIFRCLGDETMLQQVMNNLVGNALKFTEKGFCLMHLRSMNQKKGNTIAIDIEDSGIGINSEFHLHVFDSFRQEQQGNKRKYEGSGLGLAITQKYLKLLKGDILLKSEKNKGSCFTVLLPELSNNKYNFEE